MTDNKQYQPLPAPDTHCFDEDTGKDVWSYSADKMRAYVDADRAVRAARDAEDAARYRWLRARWGRMADEYDGESDQLVAIRESDSSFEGWDVDPVSLDRAIDAARAAKEGGEA